MNKRKWNRRKKLKRKQWLMRYKTLM